MTKFMPLKWNVRKETTMWAIEREGKRIGLIVRSPALKYEVYLPGKKVCAMSLAGAQKACV